MDFMIPIERAIRQWMALKLAVRDSAVNHTTSDGEISRINTESRSKGNILFL